MDSAYVSALRTASVTVLAVQLFGPPQCGIVALVGAGVLARAHLQLLLRYCRDIREIRVFDIVAAKAQLLLDDEGVLLSDRAITARTMPDAERTVRGADLVVPLTTTTTGYIPYAWLKPGALVVSVSLDDVLRDVVMRANVVIVDDWQLVRTDSRRLLGRLYREGVVVGPGDPIGPAAEGVRRIDAEMGEVVSGTKPGRVRDDDIIYVNPFGLAIEDVLLATHVYRRATELGLGQRLRV